MLEWLRKYRSLGLSVIPLRPRQKIPAVPWQEYQTRLATDDELQRWSRTWPDMNIGIVTGGVSGIAVVDLDGPAGIESAQRMGLASPVTVLSGNGRQLYFSHPGGTISNSVKAVAPGIDIRGDGGMVVAPPSLHPNGKRYAWKTIPFVRALLSGFPMELLAVPAATRTLNDSKNQDGWIAESLKEMKHGNIDNTLFKVCSRLRADGYTAADAVLLLRPHAEAAGATSGHLEEKVRHVWSRYPEGRLGSLRASLVAASASVGLSKSETLSDFLKEREPVEWVCEPFIARRSIGFVAGLPETLKTWLLVDLAVELSRADGIDGRWLGSMATGRERVLFVDQERFKGETQRRFAAVIAAKGLRPSMDLSIKCGNSVKLDQEQSFAAFRSELQELKPGVVFIDSFATLHSSPDNDRTAMQIVMEKLKTLRNEIGCAFVIIHHENKMAYPNGDPQGVPHAGTIAGSGALIAAAEFALVVRKMGAGTSIVHHVKSTLAQASKAFYASVIDTPSGIEVRGTL